MWLITIFFSLNAFAIDPTGNAVEQAQALAMKKNRKEACAILVNAIETSPPKSKAKLVDALNNIAKIFFTDNGQKLYELGQSTMFDSPDLALTHFQQALAVEDSNVAILNSVARVHLSKQDCGAAELVLQQARDINPYFGESAILQLRTFVCQQKFETLREKIKLLPVIDKTSEPYVQYFNGIDLQQLKMWRKSLDTLLKVAEAEPQFPETYYYLSRAGLEIGREVEPWQRKYVTLCKGLTIRERKRFGLEPRLCPHVKEVEDELAKKNSEI